MQVGPGYQSVNRRFDVVHNEVGDTLVQHLGQVEDGDLPGAAIERPYFLGRRLNLEEVPADVKVDVGRAGHGARRGEADAKERANRPTDWTLRVHIF